MIYNTSRFSKSPTPDIILHSTAPQPRSKPQGVTVTSAVLHEQIKRERDNIRHNMKREQGWFDAR